VLNVLLVMLLVWWFPTLEDGQALSVSLTALIFFVSIYLSAVESVFVVSQGSFFACVSDRQFGATYYTLLGSVTHAGFMIPRAFVFKLVDFFTCTDANPCAVLPHGCHGFYLIGSIGFVWGVVWWFAFMWKEIVRLGNLPAEEWKIKKHTN